LGVEFADLHGSDPKKAAQKFMKRNCQPQCMFEDMRAGPCTIHGDKTDCRELIRKKAKDVYLAGFTCQPFSQSRNGRFASAKEKGHWKAHKSCYTAEVAVRNMSQGDYEYGILENVGGMMSASKEDLVTPREYVSGLIDKTRKYIHISFVQDHGVWVDCARKRLPCHIRQ